VYSTKSSLLLTQDAEVEETLLQWEDSIREYRAWSQRMVYAYATISEWVGRREGLSLVQLWKQGGEATPMRALPKRLGQQLSSATPDAELASLIYAASQLYPFIPWLPVFSLGGSIQVASMTAFLENPHTTSTTPSTVESDQRESLQKYCTLS
jgi:hypothetical protein